MKLQISIAHNTMEGNGAPAIFAWDVEALDCSDNYFESNCEAKPGGDAPVFVLTPLSEHNGGPANCSAGPLTPNADIVISGAPLPFYGTEYPVRGVRISGSFFSPLANGSLVLLIAAVDVVMEANDKSSTSAPQPSVSLVTTGPGEDGRLFNVSGEVVLSSGFGQGQEGVGLVRSLANNCTEMCGQPTFHQFHITGVPRANFARGNASTWLPRGGAALGPMLDGVPTYILQPSYIAGMRVLVLELLDMTSMPALAGQLTYFAVRTTAAAGSLRLAIDSGDGTWRSSSSRARGSAHVAGSAGMASLIAADSSREEDKPEACTSSHALEDLCAVARDNSVGNCHMCLQDEFQGACTPAQMASYCSGGGGSAWRVESFAAVLGRSGTARFALLPPQSRAIGVAQIVVARVGSAWSDVAYL